MLFLLLHPSGFLRLLIGGQELRTGTAGVSCPQCKEEALKVCFSMYSVVADFKYNIAGGSNNNHSFRHGYKFLY